MCEEQGVASVVGLSTVMMLSEDVGMKRRETSLATTVVDWRMFGVSALDVVHANIFSH